MLAEVTINSIYVNEHNILEKMEKENKQLLKEIANLEKQSPPRGAAARSTVENTPIPKQEIKTIKNKRSKSITVYRAIWFGAHGTLKNEGLRQ